MTTRNARVRAAPSYADPRSSGKYEINHFPVGGVAGSIECINSVIRNALVGRDVDDQREIDAVLARLDGTDDFTHLGGNTVEAVSMAVAKAAAASAGQPLYRHQAGGRTPGVPHQMPNIIGGGATMGDTGWRGRTPDLQDHVILPIGCQSTWQELQAVADVFHRTGVLLRDADPGFAGGRDEEYCWLPALDDVTCLEVLHQACRESATALGIRFRIGLDVGAADLWDGSAYCYAREGVRRSPAEHAGHLADLIERFDLFYVEDGFFEDHVELYCEQVQAFGHRVLVAGDDLLAGRWERLQMAATRGAINAAVVKLNMCGTVTRTAAFTEGCRAAGLTQPDYRR